MKITKESLRTEIARIAARLDTAPSDAAARATLHAEDLAPSRRPEFTRTFVAEWIASEVRLCVDQLRNLVELSK